MFSETTNAKVVKSSTDSIFILDFPLEVLLKILSFVDAKCLYEVVILTCKFFKKLINCVDVQKTIFSIKYDENVISDALYVNSWRTLCFTYEKVNNWKKINKDESKLKKLKLSGHYAPVDAVHIMPCGTICVSGSRDRTALVWNLRDFIEEGAEVPSCNILQGHKGWVWAIDSDKNYPNQVITCSWDKSLKVWDLNSDNKESLTTYEYHPAAVLDIKCHDNVYTTSCFDKSIRVFDPRSNSIVLHSMHHRRPVVCVDVTDKYIISGSEDQTIGIYDVRAGKLLRKLNLDTPVLCMNTGVEQGFNYLRVGGKCGSLIVFDITDDRFTLLDSTQLWEHYKLTTLCNFSGCIIAGSQNGIVRCYKPDRSSTLIYKFQAHFGEVSASYSLNNLLVTGGNDNATVWTFNHI
ncbi:F-box/WD repeat-containing protein 9 isoform X3 [Hydra vulgaris]|uniref:F-box/WD repeat-containing protein 9 isoform X3 n=2 Tax=Hydra vulgaris TaxID=6087 RepID=A0ABM4D310_HYDVU